MDSGESLEELCRRLKASDGEAFEQLFRRLREDLVRYVRAIIANDIIAHDLVQDVFCYLWNLREALDPSRSIKAYLYQMARNRAFRFLRDERTHAAKHAVLKKQTSPRIPDPERQDEQMDAEVLDQRLRAWIHALPKRQREALLLSRFHGLTHREIAAIMGLSPRTVNNHIMLALKHLQERLEAFEQLRMAP